jgi:hypothetical protein
MAIPTDPNLAIADGAGSGANSDVLPRQPNLLTKDSVIGFCGRAARSRWFVGASTVVMTLYFHYLITEGSFDPNHLQTNFGTGPRFFWAQANSMLSGHLDVDPSVIKFESWRVDGKSYGYFGVFPSVLRMPFVLALGPDNDGLVPLFLTASISVAFYFALDLVRRVLFEKHPFAGPSENARNAVYLAFSALALGPASVLIVLAHPFVYQEAIAWSVAGACVFANMFWRWSRTRSAWALGVSVVALVAAANARPTVFPVGIVIAVGMCIVLLRRRELSRGLAATFATLAIAPIATAVAVFWAKFGMFPPDYKMYELYQSEVWQKLVITNGGVSNSWRYMPTNLFGYFRPDTLDVGSGSPWFGFRFGLNEPFTYLPPLVDGAMITENPLSVTPIMPVPVILMPFTFLCLLTRKLLNSVEQSAEFLLILAFAVIVIVTLSQPSTAARYVADFYPLMVAALAFSPVFLARLASVDRVIWRVITVSAFLVTGLSVVILNQLLPQIGY